MVKWSEDADGGRQGSGGGSRGRALVRRGHAGEGDSERVPDHHQELQNDVRSNGKWVVGMETAGKRELDGDPEGGHGGRPWNSEIRREEGRSCTVNGSNGCASNYSGSLGKE